MLFIAPPACNSLTLDIPVLCPIAGSDAEMKLSVIISTRNRAELLVHAIESLFSQTFPQKDFELIVADNGSTDSTRALCSDYKSRFIHFRYFYDETPGLHVGRHRGLKEAAGDILVYADDDIQALPTWLEAIWASFQDPSVMLVGGNNYPLYEKNPPSWVQRLWAASKTEDGYFIGHFSVLDFGTTIKTINPHYVYGCNFSIRKHILLEAGGFHPDSMPQELIKFRGDGETAVSEYLQKKGCKAVFNPAASIRHKVSRQRMTLKYLKTRSFNQGISDSYTSLRRGDPCKTVKAPTTGRLDSLSSFLKGNGYGNLQLLKTSLATMLHGDLSSQLSSAYKAGYTYHQTEYSRDRKLRDWVHRADYYIS